MKAAAKHVDASPFLSHAESSARTRRIFKSVGAFQESFAIQGGSGNYPVATILRP